VITSLALRTFLAVIEETLTVDYEQDVDSDHDCAERVAKRRTCPKRVIRDQSSLSEPVRTN
jgi:7-cyano-7-deazaguanine synthase in queuosine biosynthesis